MAKTITQSLDLIDNTIRNHPNWMMILKIFNMIYEKKFTQFKKACLRLGIIPFEAMDCIDNLEKMKLIESFNTINSLGEKFTHYKSSRIGVLYKKSKTPVKLKSRLIRQKENKIKRESVHI